MNLRDRFLTMLGNFDPNGILFRSGDSSSKGSPGTSASIGSKEAAKIPVVGMLLQQAEANAKSAQIKGATARGTTLFGRTPNPQWTGPAMWGWIARCAFLDKYAAVEIARNAAQGIQSLWPCQVLSAQDGNIRIQRIGENESREVSARDILEFTISVPAEGITQGAAGRPLVSLKLLYDGLDLMLKGGMWQRHLLSTPGTLSDPGLKQLQDQFEETYGRGLEGAATPIVGTKGMTVSSLAPDTRQGQIIRLIEMYSRQVLDALGFPAAMFKDGISIDTLRIMHRTVMQPAYEMWSAEISRKTSHVIEFNASSLLRGDPAERQSYYAAAIGAPGKPGWMTANEIRELEGLEKVDDPNADKLNYGDQQPVDGGQEPSE